MDTSVTHTTSKITADARVIANFEEIARHVAANHPDDITQPATTALSMFNREYIEQYAEDFEEKGEKSWVYTGGDDNE
ncbi:hypothetical protein U3A55_09475 [Salarchaeum sp. III]|uniref:hypothetical protein n=1 Tax=Salarchaeum sp. III TaxID=3107927 RepID=UPI002EDA68FF